MSHNNLSITRLYKAITTITGAALLTGTLSATVYADTLLGKKTVGPQQDGSVVLSTNQIIRPAGTQVEFRGRPAAMAISPDGKTAAYLNGYYKSIVLLDVENNTIKQEFDEAGSSASHTGIAYSHDGKQLFASQANGRLLIADVNIDGSISLDETVSLPVTSGNPYPAGLAQSEDGRNIYVALSRNNTLGVFDLAGRSLSKEIPVGNDPFGVVVKGNIAYVTNRGGRPVEEGDFTNNSSGTEIVADKTIGSAATGTVSVVDLKQGIEIATIKVELHPTAMLLKDHYLFVTNTNSDSISVIDTNTNRVIKSIAVEPFSGAPFGSSPNGLAMMQGNRLVVSLGRNNALAVYRIGKKLTHAVEYQGLIPTAWYPAAVIADDKNERLIVSNAKGIGSFGPERSIGPDPATNKTGHWVHSYMGSTSLIDYPRKGELRAYTEQVLKNNNWTELAREYEEDRKARHERYKHVKPVPIPEHTGEPSVFKHVFYIIKENRTYDQILGDVARANGDPNMLQFGEEVTPNLHALAEQFVTFDNLYDAGSLSADGHQWNVQAFVVDYLEKAFGGFTRSYPYKGGDAMAYPKSGFIWENALRNDKSVRVYGEYVVNINTIEGTFGQWQDFYKDSKILAGELEGELHAKLEMVPDVPSLKPIVNKDYPSYSMNIPDQYRVEVFLKEFKQYVENKNLPNLVIMHLPTDHTSGTRANYPTPRAMVADNDLAVGRVIDAISHSPYWKDSVVFVIEDDAQNGIDHVDGHRTIGFVASPYTRRNIVDSRYYTQIDFVRTMEQILGLPPMNQMDMAVPPDSMKHVFTRKPDFTAFNVVPNRIALDEMNPGSVALLKMKKIQQAWAKASNELDLSGPDLADSELLNRAIWYATRGFNAAYPGDGRVLFPSEVHPYLKNKADKQFAKKD